MDPDLVLEARNVSKSFPGVQALDRVSLHIRAGEVRALAGENGAGKSTLMKVLIGLHAPDSGEILFRGRPVRLRSPHDALHLGIAMIHQELMPFPDLTVAENIWMGSEPTRGFPGWLDRESMRRSARNLLGRLGVDLDPGRKMKELSVAAMQAVEIARALAHRAELVIMDEPTSAISGREAEALFAVIGDLKRRGVAVIYISHKMDEIFRLSDAVTVLRDGRHVATAPIGEVDERKLIFWMAGRDLERAAARTGMGGASAPVVLQVRGLSRTGVFRDISFAVRRGEILGIAGLMGAGRTEVASAVFGLAPPEEGEILINGRAARIRNPRDAIANGIAMVTEDRKQFGIVPEMTVKQNLTLANIERCCRGQVIDRGRENRLADEMIRSFSIRTPGRDRPAKYLSGGNQQKLVIARALLAEPEILILDEPTRGIDVGAKAEVHAIVRRLAAEGRAVVLISSEMAEILALSDRILVMRQGTVAGVLDPSHTTPEEILRHAMPA